MASTSLVNITVQVSAMRDNTTIKLNNISTSMTIGDLKNQLKVQPNSRLGRSGQFENWDNRRSLADYFVENDESFDCVVQCVVDNGQPSCDDYNEWLLARGK